MRLKNDETDANWSILVWAIKYVVCEDAYGFTYSDWLEISMVIETILDT